MKTRRMAAQGVAAPCVGILCVAALIAAVLDVSADGNKPGSASDIEGTLRHMQEMTRIAEHEMHAVVLSCKRARRDMLASLPARKPTLH